MKRDERIHNRRNLRGWNAYRRWCGAEEPGIDPGRLEAYIAHLAVTHASRPKDMCELLYGLAAALRERDPAGDHLWVERTVRAVWMASPARKPSDGPGRGAVSRQRRARLLVEDWPAPMRAAWAAARGSDGRRLSLRDRRQNDNPARKWSAKTADLREKDMGLYLAFCRSASLPLAVTPEQVEAYLAAKAVKGCSAATLASVAINLAMMARALWPGEDWDWLRDHALELEEEVEEAPKARRKSERMRSVTELRDFARGLMARAETTGRTRRAAALYQKGLIILMLTHHPVRRHNLHELRLGEAPDDAIAGGFIDRLPGGGFSLIWLKTKNGDSRVEPLADGMIEPMERWLAFWRPTLVTEESGDALWLSACPGYFGSPLTPNGLTDCVMGITEQEFGLGLGPHLFRDVAATAIVDHAPELAELIPRLLGHRNRRSCEPYIQQASSVAATRSLEDVIERRIEEGMTAHERVERAALFGRLERRR